MALGAAVVTHGSAQALQPLSAAQLAAVGCAGQPAHIRSSARGLVISGLDDGCAGLEVNLTLSDASSARVATVSGRLHLLASGPDFLVTAPASVTLLPVRYVTMAFDEAPTHA
jgi:hypothetical protein